jgi:phospholipid-binding lipoprotein MlaA
MNRALLRLLLLAGALGLAGCATVPRDPVARAEFKANHDPLEPLNRKIFAFNLSLDRHVIKPVAKTYRRVVPGPARDALRHFLDNLDEPIVFINALLQGRFEAAGTTERRFIINSTIGFAGLSDPAARRNIPRQTADFGQTLWKWGVKDGPYLIIPVFGPTGPRDGIGSGVDVYLDAFRYVARAQNYPTGVTTSRTIVRGVDERSRHLEDLDEMQLEAVDYYASFRSLYRQNRASELRGGVATSLPPPDFYDDPGASK